MIEQETNLDWKKISASKGYKSLKKAYIKDVQDRQWSIRRNLCPGRTKEDFRDTFKKSIGLVMKYAVKWDIPFIEVLDHWESERKSWWYGYYQECWLKNNKPKSVR